MTSTPSFVSRGPASRINRARTAAGRLGERVTSKRSSTAVETLLLSAAARAFPRRRPKALRSLVLAVVGLEVFAGVADVIGSLSDDVLDVAITNKRREEWRCLTNGNGQSVRKTSGIAARSRAVA